jgi:hypothetical protein
MPEAHQTLAAERQKLVNPAIRKQVPATLQVDGFPSEPADQLLTSARAALGETTTSS